MAENKKWFNKNILAMGFASLFSDLGHEMTTALLPAFIMSIGGSASILGLIEGCADAATSFIKILSGWWSDNLGRRKPFAALGYALTCCGAGALACAIRWPHVFLARIIAWLGKGLRKPARDALLVDSVTTTHFYGRVFGFHRAMDTLGALGGPALAALFVTRFSSHAIFSLAFIPELIAFLIILLLVKEVPRQTKKHTQFFESISLLPHRYKIFLSSVLMFGMGNFAPSMLILRTSELLTPTLGIITAHSISIGCYTLYNLIYASASFPLGYISDFLDKRHVLTLGYTLTSITYIGFMFNPCNIFFIAFLFMLAGFSMAIIDGGERSTTAELLPENLHGTGLGLLSCAQGIGDFISSIVVGFLWTYTSTIYGLFYAASLTLCGGMSLLITKRK